MVTDQKNKHKTLGNWALMYLQIFSNQSIMMPVAEHSKSDLITNSCFQIALKPVDIPFYKLDYGFHCSEMLWVEYYLWRRLTTFFDSWIRNLRQGSNNYIHSQIHFLDLL